MIKQSILFVKTAGALAIFIDVNLEASLKIIQFILEIQIVEIYIIFRTYIIYVYKIK